ncbi:MAG: S1C family serine protease [Akkermansiaceae bacterium]
MMKLKIGNISRCAGVFVIASAPFVYAIDPPPDDTPPPAAIKNQDPANQKKNLGQAPIPFAGLATATLPEMVADHLDVEAGNGVIVRTLYSEGPAEKAGIAVNDVILRIDHTAVGNPEAVSSLIRDHKVGDVLTFDLIHKGKAKEIKVTLGNRPADLMAQIGQEPLLDGIPDQHRERLRGLLDQNLQGFGRMPNFEELMPDRQVQDAMRKMREQMGEAMKMGQLEKKEQGNGIRFEHRSKIRMMDEDGSIEITSNGKNTEVVVRDKANQIVWEGPWDTDQDKAAAPDDIRARLDKVNMGAAKGLKFRLGWPKAAPGEIEN